MTPVERDPGAGLNGAVAAVLRAERAANSERMTQDDLAETAGIPVVSLRRYLNGQRHIDVSVLFAICDAMGLDPQWVVEQASQRLQRVDIGFTDVADGKILISDELLHDPDQLEAWLAEDVPKAARKPGRRGSKSDED